MKKINRKAFWKAFIPFFISLIVLIMIGNNIWNSNFKTFFTPEEAVYGYEGRKRDIEYLSVMEDKGLGLVFYKKDNLLKEIKIEKRNDKWKVVTHEALNAIQNKRVNNYYIFSGQYKEKYYVWINASDIFANISEPSDSLNSTFLKNVIQDGEYAAYDWFLVLDEKPENYSITVGGETVQITE